MTHIIHRKNVVITALLAMFSLLLVSFAHADQSVGEIEKIKGDVVASSFYGSKRQLDTNDLVYQGDVISTAKSSEVLVTFKDGSNFLIGADSEVVIDEMLYDRYTKEGRFISRLVRGALLLVSGDLSNKDKDVMKIKSNLATIGIRGTKAFLEIRDDEERFVLLEPEKNEGATSIHVSSEWGATLVDKINHGTIVRQGKAPTDQVLVALGSIDNNFSLLEKPSKRKFGVKSAGERGFLESLWDLVDSNLK